MYQLSQDIKGFWGFGVLGLVLGGVRRVVIASGVGPDAIGEARAGKGTVFTAEREPQRSHP